VEEELPPVVVAEEVKSDKKKKKKSKKKNKKGSDPADEQELEANDDPTEEVSFWEDPLHEEVWAEVEPDGIGYVIIDGLLETLSSKYKVKMSKKEKARALERLDPQGTEDVYAETFAEWIASDDKIAKKMMNTASGRAAAKARALANVIDPVAMRTERIDTLFKALDRQGRGVIRSEQFASLGNSVEVELTAAEMSRASHKLDPDETGSIPFEVYEAWMLESDNAIARKLFQPEVVELIEKEIADAAAEAEAQALALSKDGGEAEEKVLGNGLNFRDQQIEVEVSGLLTEDEAKALFSMLDEEVDGALNHSDFLNMSEAIGFALSDAAIAQAMDEIDTFPPTGTEVDEDAETQAARIQEVRDRAEEDARTLVHEQEDAWILLTNMQLQDETGMLDRVGETMRCHNKLGKFMVGIIVEAGAGKAKIQTQLEKPAKGTKPRKPLSVKLDRSLAVGILDAKWAAKWQTQYVEDTLKTLADEEAKASTKKKGAFEYRYRVRVEDEARQRGGENEAAWMDGAHIQPAELVGLWVKLADGDKGLVTDYQELVDLHTIKFESNGTQAMDMSTVEWTVMSEKFVTLYSERSVREWEKERRKQRQQMRNEARAGALEQPETWIPGNGLDLNDLKGEQIDIRGKGKGVVVSTKLNKMSVLLDKDAASAKAQSLPGVEVVEPLPIVIDPFKTKFRAKDPVFIRMYVNKVMKEGLMKEAQEKIAEWREIDGPEPEPQKSVTELVEEAIRA
jgi:Ca2+-binding EF-hand superfamily protein